MAFNVGPVVSQTVENTKTNIWFILFYLATKDADNNISKEQSSVLKRAVQSVSEYILPGNGDDIKNERNKVIRKLIHIFTSDQNTERRNSTSDKRLIDTSVSDRPIIKRSVDTVDSENEFHYRIENFNNTDATRIRKGAEPSFIFRLRLICERIATIIEEYRNEFISKGRGMSSSNRGPGKFRLVVVSSQVFVEAMRQYHVETVVLTYTNVFPSDIRMFIVVPIYMHGYIHAKDQM